jgi:ribosomal-protein-alanine N-acetyltransferase
MQVDLVPAALVHADLLAAMHRICFAEPWSAPSMAASLAMPGTHGAIAVAGGSLAPSPGDSGPAGFVLWRAAAGEAEILTIAVLPPWRCHGLGRRLLDAATADSRRHGAETMFLEVAAGNDAALALYHRVGFAPVGIRKGYYSGVDALTMRLDLTPPPAGH